ncbi:MAG: FlgD immunoglobulin-like domain containing protein [Kiritimatiellia bacterium]|jgi:hypothetical protein|nr:FlgD immunoglobulin-like domain containing protein [Chloroflexota bacterium]MDP7022802.1 FlgD immunoglobulin-like domain containing protein [Kiritimatiellia bacterium]
MKFPALTILIALAAVDLCSAATINIQANGTGDYPTIQAGILAASAGDEILLGDGVYVGGGNRDISFLGKAITVRSASGDASACIIDCQGSESDRHRGFRFISGEGNDSRLEQITIRNGWEFTGGGILCDGSSPFIVGCTIELCHAEYPANDEGLGGGVCNLDGNPQLDNCNILSNVSDKEGGGIYSTGGVISVTSCAIQGNAAGESGGGIRVVDCSGLPHHRSRIDGCLIAGNNGGIEGGGVWADGSIIFIQSCTIKGNWAMNGGGLFLQGGQISESNGPTVRYCVIARNQALNGGGIAAVTINGQILFCTIVGNEASGSGGGILYFYDTDDGGAISNTIIAFSAAGDAVHCWAPNTIMDIDCCDVYGNAGGDYVDCITMQQAQNGNLELDPQFCDYGNDDFTLMDTSPCLAPNNSCAAQIGALGLGCTLVAAPDDGASPHLDRLEQNQPNPFNPSTVIAFSLERETWASLAVFDARGRQVRLIHAGELPAGRHRLSWDGRDERGHRVPSGVYFYRLQTPTWNSAKRMLLLS